MTVRVLAGLTLFALIFKPALGQPALSHGPAALPALEAADVHLSPHSDRPPHVYPWLPGRSVRVASSHHVGPDLYRIRLGAGQGAGWPELVGMGSL